MFIKLNLTYTNNYIMFLQQRNVNNLKINLKYSNLIITIILYSNIK